MTAARTEASATSHHVAIEPLGLDGILALPPDPKGIIVFAHGSGSSRLSPRNARVASALRSRGLATLLFDLLSEAEANDRTNVFDIDLLGARLSMATEWLDGQTAIRSLGIGYFGASTGAAAALVAAAQRGDIRAVVSRGGRPDLAGPFLSRVKAPTLLIVGERDAEVLTLNRDAMKRMPCEKRLVTVPGATHLFEEPGTLDSVIRLAGEWFVDHLSREGRRDPRPKRTG